MENCPGFDRARQSFRRAKKWETSALNFKGAAIVAREFESGLRISMCKIYLEEFSSTSGQ